MRDGWYVVLFTLAGDPQRRDLQVLASEDVELPPGLACPARQLSCLPHSRHTSPNTHPVIAVSLAKS